MKKYLLSKLITIKILVFLAFTSSSVEACTVCFKGDPNQSANQALRMGIIAMLGVLAFVLILFIKFFKGVAKRSQLIQEEN